MDNSGLSASDALLLGGGANGGLGGLGGFGGIIGLLAVLGMIGNGGLFGNNNNAVDTAALLASRGYQPQYATQQDVQFTSQFGQLLDGNRDIINQVNNTQRDISNLITSGTAQAVAATNQAKYDNINVMKDVQMALAGQIADVKAMEQNILGNQNECCCSTKQMILENAANTNAQIAQAKYDTSMQMAQMEARLTSKMDANTIQELRDKLNNVQDQLNMAGVVRFPMGYAYNGGNFPPFSGGCGCNQGF